MGIRHACTLHVYKVRIHPIATDVEIIKGLFETKEDAWNWVENNDCPLVDYEVFLDETPQEEYCEGGC